MKNLKLLLMAALTVCLASCLGDSDDNNQNYDIKFETVNFQKASLPKDGDNPGVLIGQSYESENGFVFQNYYTPAAGEDPEYNSGYTVSNNNDVKTAGAANQYSVFSASNNKDNQFLIYNPPYGANSYIQRKDGKPFYPNSVYVAPTTYTMRSVLDGEGYANARKFTDKDTLKVKLQGCDALGEPIKGSEINFNLIQGRTLFQYNNYQGYGFMYFLYLENGERNLWIPIPLQNLGKVQKILISFDSTDKGEFGINTPQYLALDDFTTIAPESEADYEKYLNKK